MSLTDAINTVSRHFTNNTKFIGTHAAIYHRFSDKKYAVYIKGESKPCGCYTMLGAAVAKAVEIHRARTA